MHIHSNTLNTTSSCLGTVWLMSYCPVVEEGNQNWSWGIYWIWLSIKICTYFQIKATNVELNPSSTVYVVYVFCSTILLGNNTMLFYRWVSEQKVITVQCQVGYYQKRGFHSSETWCCIITPWHYKCDVPSSGWNCQTMKTAFCWNNS